MIISIVNQKGGVAKTTTTHALSSALAERGKKVLMVDFDAQSSLTICAGLKPHELPKNMYDVMCKKVPIKEIIYQAGNLFIAPSGIQLSVAELELAGRLNRENTLKKALEEVNDVFDYILIDCCPALSLLTVNALAASDRVIVPCSPDYLAYQGLQLLMSSVEDVRAMINPSINFVGIILTMADKRTLHYKEVRDLIMSRYNVLGEIGISVKVKDAVLQGQSIVTFDPNHPISLAYKSIAHSLQ